MNFKTYGNKTVGGWRSRAIFCKLKAKIIFLYEFKVLKNVFQKYASFRMFLNKVKKKIEN